MKSFGAASVLGGKDPHEVARQDGYVFAAFAQRRNKEGDDIEPIEQIFAKAAGADFALQVLVGRRDHADIDPDAGGRADRLKALFLDGAQHFGLGLERHVADFVEKQRAAVGQFKFAFLGLAGAGEGSLRVAEQFALDQLFGNGGAVDLDKRLRWRGC